MQRVVLRFIVIALVSGEFCIAFGAASAAEPKNDMVTLNAKPEPIAIDPARSAVIVVDMEHDFAAKGGMFDGAGADVSGAQKAIGPTANVLGAARQAGLKTGYRKIRY